MTVRLGDDSRKQALDSIKRYFAEEMEQEIGDLKADLLLGFFLEELAPSVYNRAIADAQARMQESIADLDGACHEPEFGFWNNKKRH